MDEARYSRVKQLFGAALELPPEEHAGWLARECADAEVRREVAELLDHARAPTRFLERCATEAQAAEPTLPAPPIPGFCLQRVLGRGGMGIVWLAEQESPRRQVAVKCLRLDSVLPDQIARFRREAEILGRLHHPGIAAVYGAGLAESEHGQMPWIAMEYVSGESLLDHVARARPDLRGLVRLFVDLCDALDHAHQNGVVHRDLKPTNVLVDEQGRVKVLDFGVARLAAGVPGETAPRTRTGQLVGTLAYMSPEQARGAPGAADARSDVYSLGVMLFELVSGALPYAVSDAHVLEGLRTICEEEPEQLRRRRCDAPADLETIVGKALAKEPARRYADAGELRDDLLRLLADRPVTARPQTTVYVLKKLVRRHPGLAGSLVVVLLALGTSVVVLSLTQRRIAAQLAETSAALDLLAQLAFRLVPTLGYREEDRAALEVVEQLLMRHLERDPGNEPLQVLRARALFELATLDLAHEDPGSAFARADAARTILDRLVPSDRSNLTAATLLSQVYAKVGESRRDMGDEAGKVAWFRRAFELDQQLVRENPADPELSEDLGWSLGRMIQIAEEAGDREEARRLAEWRLADAEALVAAEPLNWKYVYNLSHAQHFMAEFLRAGGREDEAGSFLHESLRHARQLLDMQPERRDFVEWFVRCCRLAALDVGRLGDLEASFDYAALAFSASVDLACREPGKRMHLDLALSDGLQSARAAHGLGNADYVSFVVRQLRLVARLSRSAGVAEDATRGLEEEALELEGLLAALPEPR